MTKKRSLFVVQRDFFFIEESKILIFYQMDGGLRMPVPQK